jgi:hypothetical protein
MNESNVLKTVMIALSSARSVVFRNNVAQGWVGKVKNKNVNDVTLTEYRPLHAGLVKGSSDLIGFTRVEITPEMVGKTIAVFTAIECKAKSGRCTPEQINFINIVNKSGGFAGIARDGADALNIVNVNKRLF